MRANKYEDVSQCFDTVDWMKKVITAELLTTYASYVSQWCFSYITLLISIITFSQLSPFAFADPKKELKVVTEISIVELCN